jgi:hypothetical protein
MLNRKTPPGKMRAGTARVTVTATGTEPWKPGSHSLSLNSLTVCGLDARRTSSRFFSSVHEPGVPVENTGRYSITQNPRAFDVMRISATQKENFRRAPYLGLTKSPRSNEV